MIRNGIDSFHSTNELIAFQNSYNDTKEQIISKQRELISNEKEKLNLEIKELENIIANDKIEIERNHQSEVNKLRNEFNEIGGLQKTYVQEFTYSFKALYILTKIYSIKLLSKLIIYFTLRSKAKILESKRKRFQYLDLNFEDAVKVSSELALNDLDHKKKVIDEINTFIYGAIGEQKVVNELQQLSDDYILINDFNHSFSNGTANDKKKYFANSIQIDHLLICPAGIFLIETKNWSKKSLSNLDLRSPVRQIQRTNFALLKILSNNPHIKLNDHHWGKRKISIRNLIVLINHKPHEGFEHVKILTLNELVGYVEYFKPSMSTEETQEIADYINKINNFETHYSVRRHTLDSFFY